MTLAVVSTNGRVISHSFEVLNPNVPREERVRIIHWLPYPRGTMGHGNDNSPRRSC